MPNAPLHILKDLHTNEPLGVFSSPENAERCIAAIKASFPAESVFQLKRQNPREEDAQHYAFYDQNGTLVSAFNQWPCPSEHPLQGWFKVNDIVAADPFPGNIHGDMGDTVVGVVSGPELPSDETDYQYCVDYIDPDGFWDHFHTDERALRMATPAEAATIDPFLLWYFLDEAWRAHSTDPILQCALREFFPVRGVRSIDALHRRGAAFGFADLPTGMRPTPRVRNDFWDRATLQERRDYLASLRNATEDDTVFLLDGYRLFYSLEDALAFVTDLNDNEDDGTIYDIATFIIDQPGVTHEAFYRGDGSCIAAFHERPAVTTTSPEDLFRRGDMIVVEPFPHNPYANTRYQRLGLIIEEPPGAHSRYRVAYIDKRGFLACCYAEEPAIRLADEDEATSCDPFLKVFLAEHSAYDLDLQTFLQLIESRPFPVAGITTAEALHNRYAEFEMDPPSSFS